MSRGGTRIRFAMDGRRRVVSVDGAELPEVERRRLRHLLRSLPIAYGTVTLGRDWAGRRRVSFSREIPESARQVIRNLVGNLSRLRSL